MNSLRIDVSRVVFRPLKVFLLFLFCLSFSEIQADITEKEFTRSSDGKSAKGQVFEPSRTIVRQNSRRRRSSRHKSTVSSIVLPSLLPASEEKTKKQSAPTVLSSKKPTPRYGYGSNGLLSAQSDSTQSQQPLYIFSPRYNNTQYWPAAPYYYGYGYGHFPRSLFHQYGHSHHRHSSSFRSSNFSFWISH